MVMTGVRKERRLDELGQSDSYYYSKYSPNKREEEIMDCRLDSVLTRLLSRRISTITPLINKRMVEVKLIDWKDRERRD